jgi:hypothetical protein
MGLDFKPRFTNPLPKLNDAGRHAAVTSVGAGIGAALGLLAGPGGAAVGAGVGAAVGLGASVAAMTLRDMFIF